MTIILVHKWNTCYVFIMLLAVSQMCAAKSADRTLVMSTAFGYGVDIYQRFVVSLRVIAQYQGDVVLFVSNDARRNNPAVTVLCDQYNVTMRLLNVTDHFSRHGVRVARYVAYARECNSARYTVCFATDFRDVFFQRSPFVDLHIHLPPGKRMSIGAEDARKTIGNCKHNSRWIKTCWGNEFLHTISHETIICSGAILGIPWAFEKLRQHMVAEMMRTATDTTCTARDQGHLNYLIYTGRLDLLALYVEPQGTGTVNTVGYVRNLLRNTAGDVLNNDQSLSPVIHQFDRHPNLVKHFSKRIRSVLNRDKGSRGGA